MLCLTAQGLLCQALISQGHTHSGSQGFLRLLAENKTRLNHSVDEEAKFIDGC